MSRITFPTLESWRSYSLRMVEEMDYYCDRHTGLCRSHYTHTYFYSKVRVDNNTILNYICYEISELELVSKKA